MDPRRHRGPARLWPSISDRDETTMVTANHDRPFRLAVFDFDGTLADSFPWFVTELREVAAQWRFRSVSLDEDPWLRQLDAYAVLRRLGVPRWKVPLIATDLRQRMTRDIEHIRLFDGVAPMLDRLDGQGLGLAIASSNAAVNVERVLGARLCRTIPVRECGASISGKALRLRRLLRRCGMPPERAIYIGDEIRDIAAARKVGIAAGVVSWGYNDIRALRRERPDWVFHQVDEIADLLAGDGGPRRIVPAPQQALCCID